MSVCVCVCMLQSTDALYEQPFVMWAHQPAPHFLKKNIPQVNSVLVFLIIKWYISMGECVCVCAYFMLKSLELSLAVSQPQIIFPSRAVTKMAHAVLCSVVVFFAW